MPRLTSGRRKSERITPFVCPHRPALVAYQKWARALRGAISAACRAAWRPCS